MLDGGANGDNLFGGAGGDQIFSRDGNDYIVGGPDSDAIDSGTGNDIIVQQSPVNADQYTIGGTATWRDQIVPAGGETQVNSYTTGTQTLGNIGVSSNGDYVIVWDSQGQDSSVSDSGVFARRYDASGTPIGGEFQVNTTTLNSQYQPRIAVAPNGSFVIVWTSLVQDGNARGVFGRRYDASGSPLGGEFQANSTTAGSQSEPDIAMAQDGRFVVAWQDENDGSGAGVYGQLYSADGNRVGGQFRVNSTTAGSQILNSVAMSADGSFMATWHDANRNSIYAQRYSSNGSPLGGEFQVPTTSGNMSGSKVKFATDNSFLVVWRSNNTVIGRRFNSSGSPLGTEFAISTTPVTLGGGIGLATSANGEIVVTWAINAGAIGVFGQRFDSSGLRLGDEFRINTTTTSGGSWSAVDAFPDGSFIVAWASNDISGAGVFSQRYNLHHLHHDRRVATVKRSNKTDRYFFRTDVHNWCRQCHQYGELAIEEKRWYGDSNYRQHITNG